MEYKALIYVMLLTSLLLFEVNNVQRRLACCLIWLNTSLTDNVFLILVWYVLYNPFIVLVVVWVIKF
jgi:hypothetical protein